MSSIVHESEDRSHQGDCSHTRCISPSASTLVPEDYGAGLAARRTGDVRMWVIVGMQWSAVHHTTAPPLHKRHDSLVEWQHPAAAECTSYSSRLDELIEQQDRHDWSMLAPACPGSPAAPTVASAVTPAVASPAALMMQMRTHFTMHCRACFLIDKMRLPLQMKLIQPRPSHFARNFHAGSRDEMACHQLSCQLFRLCCFDYWSEGLDWSFPRQWRTHVSCHEFWADGAEHWHAPVTSVLWHRCQLVLKCGETRWDRFPFWQYDGLIWAREISKLLCSFECKKSLGGHIIMSVVGDTVLPHPVVVWHPTGMVLPPGELFLNFLLESAHWLHGMKTWCHLQNCRYITYCNAIRGLSHSHRQHARKFCEFWPCSFQVMRVDGWTNELIAVPCIPPGGEVLTNHV